MKTENHTLRERIKAYKRVEISINIQEYEKIPTT